MPRVPTARLLVGGGLLLAGLAAWQGFAVAAARSDGAFAFPGAEVVGEMDPAPAAPEPAGIPAEVTVSIEPRARLLAPAPSACRVLVGDQEAASARVRWLAGSATWPFAPVQPGDVQLAAIEGLGPRPVLRLVPIRDPGAGAVIRLGGEVLVHGVATDEEGRPVADARVWLGGEEARTDAAGEFRAAVLAGEGLPVVVTAAGLAAHSIVLDLRGAPIDKVRFVLRPAAVVRARLLGPLPDAGGPVRVHVLPAAEASTADEAQYPYYWRAVAGGTPLGERGMIVLDDLPVGVRVQLVVEHPLLVPAAMPALVTRARPIEVALPVRAAPRLSGRVVDRERRPIPGALVVSALPDAEAARPPAAMLPLPPHAYALGHGLAWTDAAGRFALARRHGSATGRVLAAAAAHLAAELAVRATAGDLELDVLLPPSRPLGPPSLVLNAPPGSYRVRIAEAGRTPRPAVSWGGGEPFAVPLREPVLADVTVRVGSGSGAREWRGQDLALAAGVPIELPR